MLHAGDRHAAALALAGSAGCSPSRSSVAPRAAPQPRCLMSLTIDEVGSLRPIGMKSVATRSGCRSQRPHCRSARYLLRAGFHDTAERRAGGFPLGIDGLVRRLVTHLAGRTGFTLFTEQHIDCVSDQGAAPDRGRTRHRSSQTAPARCVSCTAADRVLLNLGSTSRASIPVRPPARVARTGRPHVAMRSLRR